MPTQKVSADTLLQMILDTRSDISRMERCLNQQVKMTADTATCLARIDGKLDRAINLEAKVVLLQHDVDRAKGMGILATVLLGALEGVVGIYSFFRAH